MGRHDDQLITARIARCIDLEFKSAFAGSSIVRIDAPTAGNTFQPLATLLGKRYNDLILAFWTPSGGVRYKINRDVKPLASADRKFTPFAVDAKVTNCRVTNLSCLPR